MSDFFANEPKPVTTEDRTSDFFGDEPKPVIPEAEKIETDLTTEGGVSLKPIEGGDFLDLVGAYLKRTGFGQIDPLSQAVDFSLQGDESPVAKSQDKFNKMVELYGREQTRIEDVLKEKFGNDYAGKDAVGEISLNVRDGLARRNKFLQRLSYFKRMYPEGRYYRTNVGGVKTEELYQLTPDGQIFRVDPSGGFSDFAGDFGDFLGTVATASTVGTIAGSFVTPFFGTALGSLLGQMLDEYLTDEGIEVEGGKEIWQTYSNNKVAMAVVEGTLNKILPGMGKYISAKIRGEEFIPFNFGTKKTTELALQAQKFAKRSGLPMLSIAQLTQSQIIKKLTNQLAGTSDMMTLKMGSQSLKLFEKLKQEVAGNFDATSQDKIIAYLDLAKKNLLAKAVSKVKQVDQDAKVGEIDYKDLLNDLADFKKGYDHLIDQSFTKAMQTARKDNVIFNLGDIVATAENVLTGVQGKLAAKSQQGNNIYQRIGGELQGDIKNLLNQLRSMDPNVKTIQVRNFGDVRVFDSLKQMLAVRNKLQDIAGETGDRNAIEMIKAIDKTLESPISGGTNFMKYLTQARQLTKDKADIMNYTSLATLFDNKAGVNMTKTMDKLVNGEFNAEDMNLLVKFMNVAEGVTDKSGKQIIQQKTQTVLKKLQDGFVQYVLENGETAGKVIQDMATNKNALFKKLVPNENAREELLKFATKSAQLENSGARQALKQAQKNADNALALTAGSTTKEIDNMIKLRGGMNGKLANQLRRSILLKIMRKANVIKTEEGTGRLVLNPTVFADELAKVKTGVGEFAIYRNIFPPKYMKALEDRRLYSFFIEGGKDSGADIATGAVVGQLRQGQPIGFAKTMFISNVLAGFLAKPPSVVQLQRIHEKAPIFGSPDKLYRAYTAILTSLERELDIPFVPSFDATGKKETIEEEVERTGKSPETGDPINIGPVSSITPNTLNLNLPKVSGGGNVNPPNNQQYASLFPFDTTGTAIANRKGIMSLT